MFLFFKQVQVAQRARVRGFTLVELLVVLALFTMVIVLASGALYSAQAQNVKLQQTQVILDGVNLAVEVIARDIRYGSQFYCGNATSSPITALPATRCTNGGTILVFKPSVPLSVSNPSFDRVVYYRSPNGALFKQEYPAGTAVAPATQITTSDFNVTGLTFYVFGAEQSPTDYNQPLVTVSLSGVTIPTKSDVKPVSVTLQTSASSRRVDN
jgi:prepilin-type N-terminal cleavage/methylation domain-containing protein